MPLLEFVRTQALAVSALLLVVAAMDAAGERVRAPVSDLTVEESTPKHKPAEVKLEEEPARGAAKSKPQSAPSPVSEIKVEHEPPRAATSAESSPRKAGAPAVPPPPEVIREEEPPSAAAEPVVPPADANVTVIQRGDTKIEEYRVRGKLVMSKVTPKHGVPYYINYRGTDRPPTSDRVEPDLNVPMWRIGNF